MLQNPLQSTIGMLIWPLNHVSLSPCNNYDKCDDDNVHDDNNLIMATSFQVLLIQYTEMCVQI